ncbi:MAG: P-type DNA transfer ATPase VirB11 [Proteobacteria bacterium]|nr:P-type DNA transfer ATPase VirB11 [Pseudomonadota bacterium]
MNLSLIEPASEDVFLSTYLEAFRPWLERDDVSEVLVNRPGEIWIETAGGGMIRFEAPTVGDRLLRRLAEQVARITCQGISREQPLLSATLPDGARIQFVGPPATRSGWAMSIRRHRMVDVPITAWQPRQQPVQAAPSTGPSRRSDPLGWLISEVRQRKTVLISGGTSSGKTTFLNALLREVDPAERVILVEDTPEIRVAAPNALGLVAVKGELGEARVNTDDLLQASLRLRPDRIVLGELRGREAITFLRAINTGHPGSFSTIHANSCAGALDQLVLMVMQAGLGLTRADTLAYASSVIDIIVQLGRHNGQRSIVDVRASREIVPHAGN